MPPREGPVSPSAPAVCTSQRRRGNGHLWWHGRAAANVPEPKRKPAATLMDSYPVAGLQPLVFVLGHLTSCEGCVACDHRVRLPAGHVLETGCRAATSDPL